MHNCTTHADKSLLPSMLRQLLSVLESESQIYPGCGNSQQKPIAGSDGIVLAAQVVAAGLPAVNIAYVNADGEPPRDAWPALAHAFSIFLLGSDAPEDAAALASHPAAEDVRTLCGCPSRLCTHHTVWCHTVHISAAAHLPRPCCSGCICCVYFLCAICQTTWP